MLWAGGRGGSLLSVRGLCQIGALEADGSVPASPPLCLAFLTPRAPARKALPAFMQSGRRYPFRRHAQCGWNVLVFVAGQ